jgi:penicillin-binding protein 1B
MSRLALVPRRQTRTACFARVVPRRRADALVLGLAMFVACAGAVHLGVAWLHARSLEALPADPLTYPAHQLLASPVIVKAGEAIDPERLIAHLRSIGYHVAAVGRGSFQRDGETLRIVPRVPEFPRLTLRWHDGRLTSISDEEGAARTEAHLESAAILVREPVGGARVAQTTVPYAVLAGSVLEDALLASEDKSFRSHWGVDFMRLSLWWWLQRGASTLTSQLARTNVLMSREPTVKRKLFEIGLAMVLERTYEKEQLLEAYVNSVYVGTGPHGGEMHGLAEAAAALYGVRDVPALTLVQAATVVALLNDPNDYFAEVRAGNDGRLRAQRNRVLRLMTRRQPERYAPAVVAPLVDQPVVFEPASDRPGTAGSWLIDYVTPSLASSIVERVYLTVDLERQRRAQQAVEDGLEALRRRYGPEAERLQAALVAIDPCTGAIRAMVGGRSYEASQFNRAAQARRQIGSLLKPIIFAAAVERAEATGTAPPSPDGIVVDAPATFITGGRPWSPQNADGHFGGAMTWRDALARSRNLPFVRLGYDTGVAEVLALWHRAAGTQAVGPAYPAMLLGAVEATPLQVARAYATFACGGRAPEPHGIGGRVPVGSVTPAEQAFSVPNPGPQVLRPETAALLTGMLRAVVDAGTGRGVQRAGLAEPVAGKTGTSTAGRDAWFVGFTPELLAVVWVGADDGVPVTLAGAEAAVPIWTAFMSAAPTRDGVAPLR